MKSIKNPIIVCWDVDLTLIDYELEGKDSKKLIKLGLTKQNQIEVFPIEAHIQRIKNHKASGHLNWVWSGSGEAWARHVVKRLGLERYVDFVSKKCSWYYDDSPADEWMKQLYLYPPYKRKKQ